MRHRTRIDAAPAVVMGDADLVRPLAMAGIRSAVFAQPDAAIRLSRNVTAELPWCDHWRRPAEVVDVLLAHARTAPEPPVLFPQTDGDLLVASRHRDTLAGAYRLLLADADLVEALVDKARFAALAERLDLPVPRSRAVDPGVDRVADLDLRPPYVVKPQVRDAAQWQPIEGSAKALRVGTEQDLGALWPRLAAAGTPVLVQEVIDGPEARIESYHVYVDAGGVRVAEFTGRKIRTLPATYGHSSALEITAAPDVVALGRDVIERLGLRGVAKADFKRDSTGTLWLLEINPRFTLWHHPGALAGVNIPAIVHADLTGAARPPFGPAQPGVRWCDPLLDVRAARRQGVEFGAWLRFLRSCDAVSGAALDDPLPIPASLVGPVLRRIERLR